MESPQVAYLGPEGTFAHIVARKRYGSKANLVPLPTINDVFDFVTAKRTRRGVVPMENSSGGTIYATVDELVKDRASIIEELSIKVNLALVGHRGQRIKTLYSHFAPLHHCDAWIRQNLPDVERVPVSSTAIAALTVTKETGSAALSTREAAKRYDLDILEFPVHQSITNVTQFFSVGLDHKPLAESSKTSIIVTLKNKSGSLYDFLQPFKETGVNLTRILSRPVEGHPSSYVFLIDLDGTTKNPDLHTCLEQASNMVQSLKIIGVYPVRRMYES